MTSQLYYLNHARTAEQRTKMEELEAAGVCIFCPEHLMAIQAAAITHETAHWLVTPNQFPYIGARLHLLLIPKQHAEDLADLPDPAQLDFFQLVRQLRDEYDLAHYGLITRNGDCARTGGTIRHVHTHLIVGEAGAPPVKVKITSG